MSVADLEMLKGNTMYQHAPSSFIANAHNKLYRVAQKSKPLPNDKKSY